MRFCAKHSNFRVAVHLSALTSISVCNDTMISLGMVVDRRYLNEAGVFLVKASFSTIAAFQLFFCRLASPSYAGWKRYERAELSGWRACGLALEL